MIARDFHSTHNAPNGLFDRLWSGFTPNGLSIYKYETSRENHLRTKLCILLQTITGYLGRSEVSEIDIDDAFRKLREQVNNGVHYGDNTPNSFFSNGVPATPDPYFSFGDMLSFGATGEGGFEEFARIAELRPSIDWQIAMGLIAILLVESAVMRLNHGDAILAATESLEAADFLADLFNDAGIRTGKTLGASEFSRSGGRSRHRKTEAIRVEVLKAWDSGRFDTNKSRAARWALNEFKGRISCAEVIKRWIRAHDREKTATQPAP